MHRYPRDTTITVDDLRRCGWATAIRGDVTDGYPGLWDRLSDAGSAALEEGDSPKAKALWLLADACSLQLRPDRRSAPFRPYLTLAGRRSPAPGDFEPEALSIFADALQDIDHPWLRARIADLLWTIAESRRIEHARTAIDAYRTIPLDQDHWIRGGRECWHRALALAREIGTGAESRPAELEASIIDALLGEEGAEGYLRLWLSQLLSAFRLGHNRATEVANALFNNAERAEVEPDPRKARDYYRAAREFFGLADDTAAAIDCAVAEAESLAGEGTAHRTNATAPSAHLAADCFEKAIQVYRTVPRAERPSRGIEQRIAELRGWLTESGSRAAEEMPHSSAVSIDLTDCIAQARSAVQGHSLREALAQFTVVATPLSIDALKEEAERLIAQFPMQRIFSSTHLSRDGRVLARSPGTDFSDTEPDEYQRSVYAHMVRDYGTRIAIQVQGCIAPAFQVIVSEHRLLEADLVTLAQSSAIVPPGRERLIGRALLAGFEGEFAVALHLLTPQLENLVRVHLKAAGANTTALDSQGIETEIGLSALSELPEMTCVFGEDITFEIRALFADPIGPNLRNEVAHGLIDDPASESVAAVYAWWFFFKLVFVPFWNAIQSASPDSRQDGPGSESESGSSE